MDLQIEINDQYVLNVKLNNVEGLVKPGRKEKAVPAEADQTDDDDRQATAINSNSGKRRGRPRKSDTVQNISLQDPAKAESTIDDSMISAENTLEISEKQENSIPGEVVNLPQKHIDFYHRKLEEYKEIYPAEKAAQMALDMVRQIARVS